MHKRSLGWRSLFLIVLVLAWVGRVPSAQAVTPAPDGGYPHYNTAEGEDALLYLDTSQGDSTFNTAVGFKALFLTVNSFNNTATGGEALYSDTDGSENTANGAGALYNNTTGSNNTANGSIALYFNTTGSANTTSGSYSLFVNDTGNQNTADGAFSLYLNTTGSSNTATGFEALYSNTIGLNNTANGLDALYYNGSGSYNVANGDSALGFNTTGNSNTANGPYSLLFNTTGNNNTADGQSALRSNATGSSNTALGANAGYNLTTGSNNIDIGNRGVAAESGKIRIGTKGTQTNTYIAGISGVTVAGGVGVIVGTDGKLGTANSSARYKENIQPMDKASKAILALKPVSFRYKHELDPEGIPQFGLVAEEVEKVNPALVARDDQGKPYTVRYEAVNAMLLNEFLKEHRTVQQLQATVEKQQRDFQSTIGQLRSAFKAEVAQIQKIGVLVEASKPRPCLAVNK